MYLFYGSILPDLVAAKKKADTKNIIFFDMVVLSKIGGSIKRTNISVMAVMERQNAVSFIL